MKDLIKLSLISLCAGILIGGLSVIFISAVVNVIVTFDTNDYVDVSTITTEMKQ